MEQRNDEFFPRGRQKNCNDSRWTLRRYKLVLVLWHVSCRHLGLCLQASPDVLLLRSDRKVGISQMHSDPQQWISPRFDILVFSLILRWNMNHNLWGSSGTWMLKVIEPKTKMLISWSCGLSLIIIYVTVWGIALLFSQLPFVCTFLDRWLVSWIE